MMAKLGCLALLLVTLMNFRTRDVVDAVPSNELLDYGRGPIALPVISRRARSYENRRNKDTGNSLKAANGGVFLTENSTEVVAQIGGTAKLPCIVRKFNNGVVSWIRKKDSPPTILTVGVATYIADDRFMVEHARHLQNWGLVIKYVRQDDAGLYECQVSTYPTTSIFLYLKVTEAIAEITGAPDIHIRAGSTLRLVCTLKHSTEPPAYVFWYHEQKMINHEPGVVVKSGKSYSSLELQEADTSHSGNYTCYPSNTIPAYVIVHVLNATEDVIFNPNPGIKPISNDMGFINCRGRREENPAAMLHANSSDISTALFVCILLALFANIFMTLDR